MGISREAEPAEQILHEATKTHLHKTAGARGLPKLACGLGVPGTDLLSLLVKDGGHVQQGAALVQGGCERLPLLFQLIRNLLDLLRGVVARLHQAIGH